MARDALKRFHGADGDEFASSASAEFQRELLGLDLKSKHLYGREPSQATRTPYAAGRYSLHELLHEKPDVDFDLKRQVSVAWTWSLSRVT